MLVETRTRAVVIGQAWPAYKECYPDLVGVRTKMLRTTLDDKWIPDTKRLEGMLNTTTKMIVSITLTTLQERCLISEQQKR